MLHSLKTKNIGPIAELELEFGDRLNIITGDNGLGKSFLLDIIWWTLTRTWPAEVNPSLMSGFMARPTDPSAEAVIDYHYSGETGSIQYPSIFIRDEQKWPLRRGRPGIPGLVLYAQADGSFAVWDPVRNYWFKRGEYEDAERAPAFVFSKTEVFEGLTYKGKKVCKGLIDDVSFWQSAKDTTNWDLFSETLKKVSPSPDEQLAPGQLTSIDPLISSMMPTIAMSYGQEVPVLHASSGVKRILSLAYLLTWAWTEHKRASQVIGKAPTKSIILLVDEVECHLHPKWQRTILPSIMQTVYGLSELPEAAQVQVIATTHAPLVLASLEALFDAEKDQWFDFDAEGQQVTLTPRDFVPYGSSSNWLTSKAFDLSSDTSLEREAAAEKVLAFLGRTDQTQAELQALMQDIGATLSDIDPIWLDLRDFCRAKGWEL